MSVEERRADAAQSRHKDSRPQDYAFVVLCVFGYCILMVVFMVAIAFLAFMVASR